ncbi:hypothetical protein JOC85_000889 [Bacillus mesophilus]|uniref:Uncharacterized protein n=1 Tax=Bacillus mesophilus TaxID=1808955 RepID=A0A6M0QBR3_9BACI|nr:hypothetical protein [Bacillus mesophilus]MBM7660122.1 hypothetical protein [Bacillus mesophilus]NEY73775.1 hypothetical protein [Bacillus mesophilus]
MSKTELLKKIDQLDSELMDYIIQFWVNYSHFGTWQYWITVATFITPLIIAIIFIDKRKIFQIAFFGYTFHVIFMYLDVFLSRFNFWDHPYMLIPFIPLSIAVDGALIPMIFMLAYQFAINRKKNFFVVTVITAIGVIGMAWTWTLLGMLVLDNGLNLFHVYLMDIGTAFLAYGLTNFFLKLKGK